MNIENLATVHAAIARGESREAFPRLCSMLASAMSTDNSPFIWHPYGFVTRSYGHANDGSEYRLHFWPNTERRIQFPHWPIHNHTRHIESCSLVGKAIHCRYKIAQGDNEIHNLYSVDHASDTSILTRIHNSSSPIPQLMSSEELCRGSWYTLAQNEYHQVLVPEATLFASFVRFGPQRAAGSFVIGDSNGDDRYEYRRATCDPSIVHALTPKLLSS